MSDQQAYRDANALLGSTRGLGSLQTDKEETTAEKRAREHEEWEASLRIGQNAPPITEGDVLRTRGRWKDIRILAAELAAEEERVERERQREYECPTIYETPLPEF